MLKRLLSCRPDINFSPQLTISLSNFNIIIHTSASKTTELFYESCFLREKNDNDLGPQTLREFVNKTKIQFDDAIAFVAVQPFLMILAETSQTLEAKS